MEKLKGLDLEDKKVLDAGTGGCNMTKYLEDWGADVVSIDINQGWQRECFEQTSETQFITADLSDLDFLENKVFDYVVCNFVISALSEEKNTLLSPVFREFHRVLKDDGMLVIIDYQPFHEEHYNGELHDVQTELWRLENAVSELVGKGHYEEYSSEVLEEELAAVGFTDTDTSILLEEVTWPKDLLQEHKEVILEDLEEVEEQYLKEALERRVNEILDKAEDQEVKSGSIYEIRAVK